MAYDERLAERIRDLVADESGPELGSRGGPHSVKPSR
jgi:hypothetical protein